MVDKREREIREAWYYTIYIYNIHMYTVVLLNDHRRGRRPIAQLMVIVRSAEVTVDVVELRPFTKPTGGIRSIIAGPLIPRYQTISIVAKLFQLSKLLVSEYIRPDRR